MDANKRLKKIEAIENKNHNCNLLVVQSNKLIEAFSDLSFNERNVFQYAIRRLGHNDVVNETNTITAKEYAEYYNISTNRAYRVLIEANDTLYEKSYRNKDEPITTKRRYLTSKSSEENKKGGEITFTLTPNILKEINGLIGQHKAYTSSMLAHYERCTSKHSQALLANLDRHRGITSYAMEKAGHKINSHHVFKLYYDLADVKMMFNLEPKQYPRYGNFKQRVIEQAISDLQVENKIRIVVEETKPSRKVVGITFKYRQMFMDEILQINEKREKLIQETITDTKIRKELEGLVETFNMDGQKDMFAA